VEPTYLLTIECVQRVAQGLRLSPGIRPSESRERKGIGQMMQGATLELRRPDGSKARTELINYGVSVTTGEDGWVYMQDNPADPEIRLTISGDLTDDEVPAGTELWLVNEDRD
jgi:hypothetical protein